MALGRKTGDIFSSTAVYGKFCFIEDLVFGRIRHNSSWTCLPAGIEKSPQMFFAPMPFGLARISYVKRLLVIYVGIFMKSIIKNIENFLITHEIWIKIFTLISAVFIGSYQISINSKLEKLQDYVAISAISGEKGNIELWNTGKINLYLCRWNMPGESKQFDKPRLIAAFMSGKSSFWISPPSAKILSEGQEFEFKFYLKDEFGRKWVSENGGRVTNLVKESNRYMLATWSYKMKKEDWK